MLQNMTKQKEIAQKARRKRLACWCIRLYTLGLRVK